MTQTNLVFIPASGIGHLVPAVELAKLIVQTNHNISIHFIIYYMTNESTKTLENFEYLSREVDLNRINFITLPRVSDPPDSSSPLFFPTMIQLQKPLVKQAIQDRELEPVAFIVDLVNMPMADVADELNIPFYTFFTSGPSYLNTIFQFEALCDKLGYDCVSELVCNPDTELDVRGFHTRVPANKVLPDVLLDKESYLPLAMIRLAKRFRQAKGIIVNTFMELEPRTMKALHEHDNIPKVYPVGPILNLQEYGDFKPSNDNAADEETIIMRWLDEQPPSSVVFLCSGSTGCFEVTQVKEIATGLDRSGYRFLWALRMVAHVGSNGALPSKHEILVNALPEGFMDMTAHKGKIVSWAPQVKVLAHKAVGGFVSHCGWNSIMESIWFGVPIATWPLHSDQQINAFTLVKELELATDISLEYRWNFKKQKGNLLVAANEVEKGVKILMTKGINDKMRVKLREMSHMSKQVLQHGGSSYKWLTSFIEEVTEKVNLNLDI